MCNVYATFCINIPDVHHMHLQLSIGLIIILNVRLENLTELAWLLLKTWHSCQGHSQTEMPDTEPWFGIIIKHNIS